MGDDETVNRLIHWCVGALAAPAAEVADTYRASDMSRTLHTFDGLVACVLNDDGVKCLPDVAYMRLLFEFGDRVLKQVLCGESARAKFKRFNCETLVSECFHHWKESVDPEVRDHLLQVSPGWALMDKLFRKRDGVDTPANTPRGDSAALYDFSPVVLRTPIYTGLTHPKGPNPESKNREISRIHISFFRYLISKREFSRSVVSLINAHNTQALNPSLNDSNVTIINQSPPGRRPSSVDSLASYRSTAAGDAAPTLLNAPLDLFSTHCFNFFAAFGTGLLIQISNDIVNAMTQPPTDFLRLMIAIPPHEASVEAHSAVRKYLSAQLLASLRNLVHNRGHHTAAEDGCLSFLMKAEMSVIGRRRWNEDYRVVSALLISALRFTVFERESLVDAMRSRFMGSVLCRDKINREGVFMEWLSVLAETSEEESALVRSIVNSPEGKRELRAIYREIAAANVSTDGSSHWEVDLSMKINKCKRIAKSDLRLLVTTANGLGITPVPVGDRSIENRLSFITKSPSSSVGSPDTEQQRPVTTLSPEPTNNPSRISFAIPTDPMDPLTEPTRQSDETIVKYNQRISELETQLSTVTAELSSQLTALTEEVNEMRRQADSNRDCQDVLFLEIAAIKAQMAELKEANFAVLERDDPIVRDLLAKINPEDEQVQATFRAVAQGGLAS